MAEATLTPVKTAPPKDLTSILNNFKLSDLFQNFNSSVDNDFIFDDVEIKLSVSGNIASSENIVSFSGKLRMDNELTIFKNYLDIEDAILITGSFTTDSKNLSGKIAPKEGVLKCTIPFHKQVFQGVTLTLAWFQLDIRKDGTSWAIVPGITGQFDVDHITDKNIGEMQFSITRQTDDLVLNATAKQLTGCFGIDYLTLTNIEVTGTLGDKKSLSLTSDFLVGHTTLQLDGNITEDAVGVIAKADSFTLDDLTNLYKEAAPTGLQLPEFDVDFKNTSIALASVDTTVNGIAVKGGFTIISDVVAQGITFQTTAFISHLGVTFSETIENITIGPVAISNTQLDFEIYPKTVQKPTKFEISGDAVIEGIHVACSVYFEKLSTWTTVLSADINATNFRLSNIFSEAKGTFIDSLSFSKLGFIYVSADSTIKNQSLKKGIQLIGVLEEIPGLTDLTGEKHIGLVLTAHFGDTTDIGIAIPETRLNLGHSVVCDPLKIQINITPQPAFMVIFGMDVSVPKQDTPLHFDMALKLDAIEAEGSVTMKNYWKNPFGIQGLKIGPALAIQLGIIYEQFVSTGIPSEFGFAGGLVIGDTEIDMAVSISENPSEEILMGKLAELDIKDLISFASSTFNLAIPEVPDFFKLKDLEIYCAPSGGMIGTITYQPGFSFSGDVVIAGKEIAMYTLVSGTSIEGSGHIDNLTFGPLSVSGEKGKDATAQLKLSPTEQSLLVDGSITFLGVEEGVFLQASNKGVAFKFTQNFFDKLTFEVNGQSSGAIDDPKNLDFALSGEMDNDITSYLKNEVSQKLEAAIQETETDINTAEQKVETAKKAYEAKYAPAKKALDDAQQAADAYLTKLTNDLNNIKATYVQKISDAEVNVNNAKSAYDTALNNAQDQVNKAQQTYNDGITDAQNKVNSAEITYNNGITDAQNKVNSAEAAYNNSIGSAERAVENASKKCDSLKKNHYNYGTTWVAYKAAKGVLALAEKALEGIKYGADYTAFEAAKAALTAAKTGANYTAFMAAKAALDTAKTGANLVAFNAAKATLEGVKNGGDYTVWQGALKTLSAVQAEGQQAIADASTALDTIGKSSVYVALEAAKAELTAVEKGTEFVTYDTAQTALEAAKVGAKGILELADYVAKHAGDIIDIKKFTFSGSLKKIESGDLFDAELDVSLLGNDHQWEIDFNVKDITGFITSVFKKALDELKQVV